MQNSHSSLFHTELFNYLLGDVEKKMQEEGLTQEKEFASYKHILKSAAQENHSFVEILENYHRLFFGKKTLSIEKKLLEAFPPKEFPLKISRGLPRLYKKENPSISRIKQEFSHLPSLKQLGIDRFILPLYENYSPEEKSKICIFTYVLSDGWGDFIAAKEVAKILKKKFPKISIQSIICAPQNLSLQGSNIDDSNIIIPYTKEASPSLFPKKAIQALQSADVVLSIPTFYPYTAALKKNLKTNPSFISIGQYGFIESEWFHPKSGNKSMGLHFLEQGILIREQKEKGDFRSLENQTLLFSLFGTITPQTVDIEAYLASHKFFLAYLISPIGGAIYLHALLQVQAQNDKTIDICSPDLGWLIEFIDLRHKENKPLLEGDFGVQELEIHFGGKIHRRILAQTGKKVRILCPGPLSDKDFRKAISLSEEFVAIRGDQSFSEAVSVNRPFFYDGAPHARYFMKDLLALAENRLSQNKMALSFFRCMGKAYLYNISDEPSDWVEETYFQEKEPWAEIAKNLSLALQSPDTALGCKQLNQIIKSEYSFNKSLCQIVARELFHRRFPVKKEEERKELLAFTEGKKLLKETLNCLKALLA